MEIKKPFDKFLMFDVESVGLHGEAFAVGWVVMEDGKQIASAEYACDPDSVAGTDSDRAWVAENVKYWVNSDSRARVGHNFWDAIEYAHKRGFAIVTDCCWPVETNWLKWCLDTIIWADREYKGPYPLYDASSVLAALGYDPIGTYPRLPNELPAHNALNDARQSARVLIEALSGTLQRPLLD